MQERKETNTNKTSICHQWLPSEFMGSWLSPVRYRNNGRKEVHWGAKPVFVHNLAGAVRGTLERVEYVQSERNTREARTSWSERFELASPRVQVTIPGPGNSHLACCAVWPKKKGMP